MPLSKEKQAKYQRDRRRRYDVIPKSLPGYLVHPNVYLQAHIKAYPQGFNVDGSYRADYDENLDPYINPLVRHT